MSKCQCYVIKTTLRHPTVLGSRLHNLYGAILKKEEYVHFAEYSWRAPHFM